MGLLAINVFSVLIAAELYHSKKTVTDSQRQLLQFFTKTLITKTIWPPLLNR